MARAPYQVLVLPYRKQNDQILYCMFKRRDEKLWQFIAGGGEEEDGSILVSAKREAFEEAGISRDEKYTALETVCSIRADCFKNAKALWGENCFVIPEYTFAVELPTGAIQISREHTQWEWADYASAEEKLRYDSNKTALWELNEKIKMGLI